MSDGLEKDFDLEAVAQALGMSTRWVRQQCKDGAVHNRYGKKIRFTAEQVQKLRDDRTKRPAEAVEQPVTTGRGKKAKSA